MSKERQLVVAVRTALENSSIGPPAGATGLQRHLAGMFWLMPGAITPVAGAARRSPQKVAVSMYCDGSDMVRIQ